MAKKKNIKDVEAKEVKKLKVEDVEEIELDDEVELEEEVEVSEEKIEELEETKKDKKESKKEKKNNKDKKDKKEGSAKTLSRELKKVVWPKAGVVARYTLAVVIFCVILCLFFEGINLLAAFIKGLFV